MINLTKKYQKYIKSKNLKSSKTRDLIFNYIIKKTDHFTIDTIQLELAKIAPEIGIATIYRTIRLLVECEVLIEHSFKEKKGFFEVNQMQNHGHLICATCGNITEFRCDEILKIFQDIGDTQKFEIHSYKLEFYGKCKHCLDK